MWKCYKATAPWRSKDVEKRLCSITVATHSSTGSSGSPSVMSVSLYLMSHLYLNSSCGVCFYIRTNFHACSKTQNSMS